MTEFAGRLKELREYHGLTQGEVAKCVNLSPAAIGNYERGAREPSIRELILLADFLDVSVDYLIGRIDDMVLNTEKTQVIHYAIIDTLEVSEILGENEIDMIISILANGKKYSWCKTKL